MGKYPVSPLAPEKFPDLPVIKGVRFAAVEAGVRYADRLDVMLAVLDPGSVVAGVFTRSSTRSAPVRDCEAKLRKVSEAGAAILVNSGNSNAFTGSAGQESVEAICAAVAEAADVPKGRVFTSSTGVIGERLPHDRITAKVGELVEALDEGGIARAAQAIMTTDTFAKGATREIELKGGVVKIAGIAKGSGMIAPDMATMLVYIFTDAKVSRDALQAMVSCHNETTFNAITVDGDTSTSDTLICAATGASGVDCDDSEEFEAALKAVMKDLAHQVVKDGEGATKFVAVKVTGAAHDADAKRVAMSIANSPLVKTAIAGEDPNWGRIVAAVGKSGAEADRDKLTIRFGEVLVAERGWVAPGYSEEQAAGYMKLPELVIGVDLGLGKGRFTAWTCDLTHQYISINADYRS
ncbi:bifunctional glutamate N-acetyltransferase/amino-acid acetyltransferase ArgJ [Vannielia litorea]|uniref:Arginine biosynthesis bifunctional protein ArgJ n=1 Tax=Vannielia litorea TaxID=1217970 RepID=A0A1N6HHN8_9RHOB|nr:bifunctional glutamate N-acetyltransferase/amino-acid acetyltransferase ArgJ [Vannielia litorea]SIO19368.1 glutamate N-acetyltransferase [Vannielia litorea]